MYLGEEPRFAHELSSLSHPQPVWETLTRASHDHEIGLKKWWNEGKPKEPFKTLVGTE